jgi:microcystin-dependent protein
MAEQYSLTEILNKVLSGGSLNCKQSASEALNLVFSAGDSALKITGISSSGATVGTAAARAGSSPSEGDIWIESDTGKAYYYRGDWKQFNSPSLAPFSTEHNADGTHDVKLTYAQMPTGTILPIMHTETPPTGTLECDGSAISRSTYSDLYALFGDMYGDGDGSTTFNLPDLRGRFMRGWDHGAGTDPDAASRTDRGDTTTGDHVGTLQADEYESHNHGPDGAVSFWYFDDVSPNYVTEYTSTDTNSDFSSVTASSGGNETRPKNINVMFVVVY